MNKDELWYLAEHLRECWRTGKSPDAALCRAVAKITGLDPGRAATYATLIDWRLVPSPYRDGGIWLQDLARGLRRFAELARGDNADQQQRQICRLATDITGLTAEQATEAARLLGTSQYLASDVVASLLRFAELAKEQP